LQGKNKKNCLPKMESVKVHLPMIEKADAPGASIRLYGAPVAPQPLKGGLAQGGAPVRAGSQGIS